MPSMTEALAADLKDRLAERLRHHPISRMLHPRLLALSSDTCELMMPFREEITNGYGVIHGGHLATLADSAMAFALATNFDGEMSFATADLTIHFFKRARTDVTARARVIKKGRRIHVGLVEIFDTAGDLVATVLTSFMVRSPSAEDADA